MWSLDHSWYLSSPITNIFNLILPCMREIFTFPIALNATGSRLPRWRVRCAGKQHPFKTSFCFFGVSFSKQSKAVRRDLANILHKTSIRSTIFLLSFYSNNIPYNDWRRCPYVGVCIDSTADSLESCVRRLVSMSFHNMIYVRVCILLSHWQIPVSAWQFIGTFLCQYSVFFFLLTRMGKLGCKQVKENYGRMKK